MALGMWQEHVGNVKDISASEGRKAQSPAMDTFGFWSTVLPPKSSRLLLTAATSHGKSNVTDESKRALGWDNRERDPW